jgi:carboxypeptidase Q
MCDTFGHRLTGSEGLNASLDWIEGRMREDGLNVTREPVGVPSWTRGDESLIMLSPRVARIAVIGLGKTVGTAGRPIQAELVVVQSWDELSVADVKGRIVLMNAEFTRCGHDLSRLVTVRDGIRTALFRAQLQCGLEHSEAARDARG